MTEQVLQDALEYARPYLESGKVATYIPELGKANPAHLGVSVMTEEGQCFSAGDWAQEFTMQSIAKTITLILALQMVGRDEVFRRVGVEPTGDAFNSMVKLVESETFVPSNPMINAGAISTASCCLRPGMDPYTEFLKLVRKLCGRDTIEIDYAVYRSEKETGTRNRAMAHFLEGAGVLLGNAEETVDFYFKTCSTSVNTKDLAHYAMVLANHGKHPLTGEVLIDAWTVPIVKTIMFTCGMYDAAGEFAMKVGMPAKGGVGGGIIASADNRMGIATFGPALDPKYNSVGGGKVLEYLSKTLGLHLFA
ncbi:MAG: glutaminase A [Oscillospiraceae bacterium]|nr:glutaminase A [Oscillospiraceae bacterium]